MIDKVKLDIIIPAYNCIATLRRTLDSLVSQTNQHFSVLLVDDCSTQNIKNIVDEYANVLSIRYIVNPENRGCGMTRQRGIDETDADYIAFLDSDDILLPNAVEVWLSEIRESQPDVLYSAFLYARGNNVIVKPFSFGMCHGKVYRVSFLKKYDIRESEEVKCIDDAYLNWQAFDLADKVSVVKYPTYVQIDTRGSITNAHGYGWKAAKECIPAKQLAIRQISRFKENPLSQYNEIYKRVTGMLLSEEQYYREIIKKVNT